MTTSGPTETIDVLLEHRAFLERLAREFAPTAADAEDLFQEAWIALLRRPPEHTNGIRSWLRRLVFQQSRNRWRATNARRHAESRFEEHRTVPTPDELFTQTHVRVRLRTALESLRPEHRQVLGLRYIEGLSTEAIARRLDLPPETVRSRRRRALERMRQRLGVRLGEERREPWLVAVFPFLRRERAGDTLRSGWPWAVGLASVALVATLVATLVITRAGADGGSAAHPTVVAAEKTSAADTIEPPPFDASRRTAPTPTDGARALGASADVRLAFRWDDDDEPATDVPVLIESWSDTTDPSDRSPELRWTRTDEQGRCTGPLPGTGPWRISPLVGSALWLHAEELDGDVPAVLLPRPRRVAGSVRGPDGEALAQARILASWPDRRAPVEEVGRSAADGGFLVDVDAGSWVAIEKEGLVQSELFRVLPDSGDAALHVRLGAGEAGRTGRVLDPFGRPLAGAHVFWTASDPVRLVVDGFERTRGNGTPLVTAADGSFALPHLRSAATEVVVIATGYRPLRRELGPAETEVELVLEHPANVTGLAVDADGSPAPGVTVELFDLRGRVVWTSRTDLSGAFDLGNVAPGRLTVIARDPHGRGGDVVPLDVRPGQDETVLLRLTDLCSIRGRVTDRDGSARGECTVLLEESRPARIELRPGKPRTTVAAADGSFRFDGLAGNAYDVYVLSDDGTTRVAWGLAIPTGSRDVRLTTTTGEACVTGTLAWLPRDARLVLACVESGHVRTIPTAASTLALSGLVPGTYELGFVSPTRGRAPLTRFSLQAESHLDLGRLDARAVVGRLAGRVLVSGHPPTTSLELRITMPGHQLRAQTDHRGSFELQPDGSFGCDGLVSGPGRLRVSVPGGPARHEDFVIRAGEETYLEIALD